MEVGPATELGRQLPEGSPGARQIEIGHGGSTLVAPGRAAYREKGSTPDRPPAVGRHAGRRDAHPRHMPEYHGGGVWDAERANNLSRWRP